MACFRSYRAQEGRYELPTRPSSGFEGTRLEYWRGREDRSRWAVSRACFAFPGVTDPALAQNWRWKVVHHDGSLPHRRVDVRKHRDRRARHLQDGPHRSSRTHRHHSSGTSFVQRSGDFSDLSLRRTLFSSTVRFGRISIPLDSTTMRLSGTPSGDPTSSTRLRNPARRSSTFRPKPSRQRADSLSTLPCEACLLVRLSQGN